MARQAFQIEHLRAGVAQRTEQACLAAAGASADDFEREARRQFAADISSARIERNRGLTRATLVVRPKSWVLHGDADPALSR